MTDRLQANPWPHKKGIFKTYRIDGVFQVLEGEMQ